jgi:hypothetical protein
MYENTANATKVDPRYLNGGAGTMSASVATMPLDELAKQLEAARERITQSSTRVRTIADVLFGPLAEMKEGANNIKPSPNGRVHGLNEQANALHYWLGELEGELNRLNPLG